MNHRSRLSEDFSGISRNSKLYIGGSFLGNLALGVIFTDLSYFLHSVRGISIIYAGLVFTIEGLSSSIFAIPFGMISDRKGRKMMIVYGNLILGLSVILIALVTRVYLFLLISLVLGTSDAAFTSSGGALLSEFSSNEKRTATFSLSSLASNGAWAGGGFLLYVISPLSALGFNVLEAHVLLYLALGIATLGSTAVLIRIKENPRKFKPEKRKIISSQTKKIISRYVASNIGISIGAGLFVPLMSQWFNYRYGIPDTVSGPILGISGALLAFSALIAPALGRRLGIVKAMVLTMSASTIFMVLTPLPSVYQISALFYITRSLLMNVSGPLSTSLIMGVLPSEERGVASGISSIFFRMPNSLSTYPGSYMMKEGKLSLPFDIASVLYIVSIVLFFAWFRKVKLPEDTSEENQSKSGIHE